MKVAYVFPGQGSQRLGMGADLFEQFPDFTETADSILGYSIKELCTEDPDGNLGETQYTQPALFVVNALSYYARTEESGEKPDFLAGHSLGEFNALLASEAFDFPTGLRIVQKRGSLMSEIEGGGMAAVIGLEPDKIAEILADSEFDTIDIANYNSPTQIVISGPKQDVSAIIPVFEATDARMVIELKVSGAFHSRYMADAHAEFSRFLKNVELQPLQIPVVSNALAKFYQNDTIRETLASQITRSVQWTESICYLLDQDEIEFSEIGPGNVLTGLIRQIKKRR